MEQEKKEMCNITNYIDLSKDDASMDISHMNKLFYYRVNTSHEISIYTKGTDAAMTLMYGNYRPHYTNGYLSQGDIIGIGLIKVFDKYQNDFLEVVTVYLDNKFIFVNLPVKYFSFGRTFTDITKYHIRDLKLNKILNERT